MHPFRLFVVGGLAVTLTVGCTDVVAGDSIVMQAAITDGVSSAYGTAESVVDGVALRGVSGTAPCDYVGARSQQLLDKYHPTIVSISLSGNAFTPCMKTVPYVLTSIVAKYRADLIALTNWWTGKGVKVIYSAPVCRKPGAGWVNGDPAFRVMEAALATDFRRQGKRVTYANYAGRQICPNWTWTAAYRDPYDPNGLHLNSNGAKVYARALRWEIKHTAV